MVFDDVFFQKRGREVHPFHPNLETVLYYEPVFISTKVLQQCNNWKMGYDVTNTCKKLLERLRRSNIAPQNRPSLKWKVVFQPSFFVTMLNFEGLKTEEDESQVTSSAGQCCDESLHLSVTTNLQFL